MFNFIVRKPVTVTVWFNCIDAQREFDQGCDLIPQKWLLGIRTITGGFDDGHATIQYPCRRSKTREIERQIKAFNKYAKHFGVDFEAKRVG